MTPGQDFEATANELVEECFPEHTMFWSIKGADLTAIVRTSKDLSISRTDAVDGAEFNFGGELVPILQGASAVAGLVSSLIVIYNNFYKSNATSKEPDIELIANQLKSGGVAADKAAKIIDLVAKHFK